MAETVAACMIVRDGAATMAAGGVEGEWLGEGQLLAGLQLAGSVDVEGSWHRG